MSKTISWTLVQQLTRKGQVFVASHRFTGVSDNTTNEMFLSNGSSSGVDLLLIDINLNTTGLFDVTVNFNVTESSQGTVLDTYDLNTRTDNSSAITATHGGSYSGQATEPPIETIVPANENGPDVGSDFRTPTANLAEGDNLLVEFTNRSGGSARAGITLEWAEVDAG